MKNDELNKIHLKISSMKEYQLLYYDNKCHDQLVALLIKFKTLGLYIPKEIFELIVNDRIINRHITPIAHARVELNKLEYWSPRAKFLAKKARLHWSKLSDQFITDITTNKQKEEILEASEPNVHKKY